MLTCDVPCILRVIVRGNKTFQRPPWQTNKPPQTGCTSTVGFIYMCGWSNNGSKKAFNWQKHTGQNVFWLHCSLIHWSNFCRKWHLSVCCDKVVPVWLMEQTGDSRKKLLLFDSVGHKPTLTFNIDVVCYVLSLKAFCCQTSLYLHLKHLGVTSSHRIVCFQPVIQNNEICSNGPTNYIPMYFLKVLNCFKMEFSF